MDEFGRYWEWESRALKDSLNVGNEGKEGIKDPSGLWTEQLGER